MAKGKNREQSPAEGANDFIRRLRRWILRPCPRKTWPAEAKMEEAMVLRWNAMKGTKLTRSDFSFSWLIEDSNDGSEEKIVLRMELRKARAGLGYGPMGKNQQARRFR